MNLLVVTVMASRILRWLLYIYFWKICPPLLKCFQTRVSLNQLKDHLLLKCWRGILLLLITGSRHTNELASRLQIACTGGPLCEYGDVSFHTNR